MTCEHNFKGMPGQDCALCPHTESNQPGHQSPPGDQIGMDEACGLVSSLLTRVDAGDGPVVAAWCSRVAARLWIEGGGDPADAEQMHRAHLQAEARRQTAKPSAPPPPPMDALVKWAQMDDEARYMLGLMAQWKRQQKGLK